MKTLTLSIHYPKTLLRGLQGREELRQTFLREVNITPSVLDKGKVRVPIESHVKLYQLIAPFLDDESFGYFEQPLRYGTFAIACEYAANSATIGEALDKICRFYRIVTDDIELRLETIGSDARFVVELRRPELDVMHFMVETFLCIGFRFASWLAGRAIPLKYCDFSYTPTENLAEYVYLFPCPHHFDVEGANALSFAAEFLALPVLKTAADIDSYNARAPQDLLNKLIGNDSLTNRIYVALSRKGKDELQDAKTLASEMAMTEQTLRRKLRQEGNTVQKIKDNLRLDTAVFHLTGSKYTIAEISERLGFSTPSAFSRAFKNWTGVSPENYRNR
jgi:AraC-like DNA-binding protein